MAQAERIHPVIVDGLTIGEVIERGEQFVIPGMDDKVFKSVDKAQGEILKRRSTTIDLTAKFKSELAAQPITIGKSLFAAMLDLHMWPGKLLSQSKTQVTLEVESVDHLRTGLLALVSTLEDSASSQTRTASDAMRSRALIGAARQQLARF